MTGPEESPEELGSPADADATLASKLCSLRNIEIAIGDMIAARNEAAARQLDRIARQHALLALEAALGCAAQPPSARASFSVEDVRHAEARLGIEPDTFTSFFAVNFEHAGPARRKALGELLAEVRDEIAAAPADKPLRETPSWLAAVIRIGSAVLVGAAVGAPLAALAVGEPVVVEVAKAGIAVTACAIAGEVTNHVLERWLRPPVPVEPPAPHAPHHRTWLPRDEPVEPPGALPAPTEQPGREPVAAQPARDLAEVAELVRRGRALLDSLERGPASPEDDPIRERTNLEPVAPEEIEPPVPPPPLPPPPPPPPPPPKPTRLDDSPFGGFGL